MPANSAPNWTCSCRRSARPRSAAEAARQRKGERARHSRRSARTLLRGEQEMLIERIRRDADLDPLAAAGDDRKHRKLGLGDPHIVLQLRHVFSAAPLRRTSRQHELGLENAPVALDKAVEGCGRPAHDRMLHMALDIAEDLASVAFEPVSVKGFGYRPRAGR